MRILPPALKRGDTIGIIAPSSHMDRAHVAPAEDMLAHAGFSLAFHPQTLERHGQFAGTMQDKIQAVHDNFSNPNIKAIICMLGGNGSLHLLDHLDYGLIQNNPKIFMGFSDSTALCNAITHCTGLVTFHGSTLSRFHKIKDVWQQQTLSLLMNKTSSFDLPGSVFLQGNHMSGELIGVNLSVFQALIGTPYLPDPSGRILCLEDTGDHLSRYDRMMGHLRLSGYLSQLSGLMIGQFLNTQDNPDRPFGFSIEDIIREHTSGLDIPVLMNAPFGHGDDLPALPIGSPVAIDSTQLTLLSSLVQ